MPRVKAPPVSTNVPSDSLAGLTIGFAQSNNASIPSNHARTSRLTFAQLKDAIISCQGKYTTKVDQCTHLVADIDQFNKPLARVKEALKNADIEIVNFDWLAQSLESSSRVDTSPHLLRPSAHKQASNTAAVNGTQKTTQKRARDDESDSDQKQQNGRKKKKKSANIVSKNQSPKVVETLPSTKIPVDVECPDRSNYTVLVDDQGVIFDVTLNQTNAGNNNNKYYRIQLLKDAKESVWCWTRWGRVGDRGQTKMIGNGDITLAIKEFQKKFKDKNGNSWDNRESPARPGKYTLLEMNYEESSEDEDGKKSKPVKKQISEESSETSEDHEVIESKLPGAVTELMRLIFNSEYFSNTLAAFDYDANKMPLGKLSKKTLLQGYEVLKDLAALITDPTLTGGTPFKDAIEESSNRYFSLIPHDFGRRRPAVLSTMDPIKKEIELLENLTDMQLANEIMKHAKGGKSEEYEKMSLLDRQYLGLGLQEMTPLDTKSQEYTELENYLVKSSGSTHNIRYKVQDVFRIERNGEHDRFNNSPYSSLYDKSDRRLLWHGSRCTNFGGILSQGLRIAPPEAPVSGYMFGKGVYLADMSTKSANYCCHYNSGGVGLLLLCEAELGKPPLKLTDTDPDAGDLAKTINSISTWGVGRTAPQGWKDASCVHEKLAGVLMPDVSIAPGATNEPNALLLYNEYICYDVSQLRLRYLLRVQMN